MLFKSIMHIAFFTDNMEEMLDFYQNKLGAKLKVLIRYKEYLHRNDRPEHQKIAMKFPNKIFNAYLEIAPEQFLELFPKSENQGKHLKFNECLGYSHFSLLVEDIYEVKRYLIDTGVNIDTDITKGPSETYQMWITDPDNNRIEVMQFTDSSYQVIGKISD